MIKFFGFILFACVCLLFVVCFLFVCCFVVVLFCFLFLVFSFCLFVKIKKFGVVANCCTIVVDFVHDCDFGWTFRSRFGIPPEKKWKFRERNRN